METLVSVPLPHLLLHFFLVVSSSKWHQCEFLGWIFQSNPFNSVPFPGYSLTHRCRGQDNALDI